MGANKPGEGRREEWQGEEDSSRQDNETMFSKTEKEKLDLGFPC